MNRSRVERQTLGYLNNIIYARKSDLNPVEQPNAYIFTFWFIVYE